MMKIKQMIFWLWESGYNKKFYYCGLRICDFEFGNFNQIGQNSRTNNPKSKFRNPKLLSFILLIHIYL